MPAGAPLGNNNAGEGKRYRKALERALAHRKGSVEEGLLAVALARIDKAIEGDNDACREIGDRFDGKPVQAIAGADGEGPVRVLAQVTFVAPDA
jgi:hypothetical protein